MPTPYNYCTPTFNSEITRSCLRHVLLRKTIKFPFLSPWPAASPLFNGLSCFVVSLQQTELVQKTIIRLLCRFCSNRSPCYSVKKLMVMLFTWPIIKACFIFRPNFHFAALIHVIKRLYVQYLDCRRVNYMYYLACFLFPSTVLNIAPQFKSPCSTQCTRIPAASVVGLVAGFTLLL